MKRGALLLTLAILIGAAWYMLQPEEDGGQSDTEKTADLPDDAMVAVKVPDKFSKQEQIGKRTFDAACAECHGVNAKGREGIGPPLVHKIYEPSHHGDMAFVIAAKNGVRSHHWRFGNMPPAEGLTQADVLNIVTYIRALQRENGID